MRWEDWKFSARLGWQDPYIRWIAIASLLLVSITGGILLLKLLPEGWRSGVITMHYNIYLGIDDVRPWPWIFVVPSSALGATIANILLALGLFWRHGLASRTLLTAGLAVGIVWSIGVFFLIRVNL